MTGDLPVQPLDGGAARSDQVLDARPVRFTQAGGAGWVEWEVVEVNAASVPGARAARCLVFTRQDCIRRVWHYPADWRTLDDAALAALSWQR